LVEKKTHTHTHSHTSKDIKQFTFTVSAKKTKKTLGKKPSQIANEMKSAAEINHKRGAAKRGRMKQALDIVCM